MNDTYRCATCGGGIMAPNGVWTSQFVTWAVAIGWRCEQSTTSLLMFCPMCWREKEKTPAKQPTSAMDLF